MKDPPWSPVPAVSLYLASLIVLCHCLIQDCGLQETPLASPAPLNQGAQQLHAQQLPDPEGSAPGVPSPAAGGGEAAGEFSRVSSGRSGAVVRLLAGTGGAGGAEGGATSGSVSRAGSAVTMESDLSRSSSDILMPLGVCGGPPTGAGAGGPCGLLLGSILKPLAISRIARSASSHKSEEAPGGGSAALLWPSAPVPGGVALPNMPCDPELLDEVEAALGPPSVGVRLHRQSFATWLDDSPPDSPGCGGGGEGGCNSPPGIPRDQQYLYHHLRQTSSLRSRWGGRDGN